jgi:predicted glycoside hydrolase/deacetylase ChbG (UPF0249 family)
MSASVAEGVSRSTGTATRTERTAATSRHLAICVDDFGSAPGIAAAVESLARRGRVQAVSCLVTAGGWRRDAPRLASLGPRVEAGLHFDLTEGPPLSQDLARAWPSSPSLPRLLALAHLGKLPLAALRAEVVAQLDAFVAAIGAAPRFVDGHQHVHHLPGVREPLLEAIESLQPRPAVRDTGRILGPGHAFKRAVIAGTGGRHLHAELERRGLAHNAALTGVYDFIDHDYGKLMRGWLGAVPAEGALLFCHPAAAAGLDAADSIGGARPRELAYLLGDEFGCDLEAAGVTLGAVWQVSGTTTRG